MRFQHKQRKAIVSKKKCRVVMTGTHQDEGLGIIGWKVILVKVNRSILHRCDTILYIELVKMHLELAPICCHSGA